MTVNFMSSRPVFKAESNTETCKCEHPVCEKCGKPIADAFSTKNEPMQKKKGFLSRVKDRFINIRKSFIDFGYVMAGTVKGAVYGAITAGGVAGVIAIRNIAKKAPKTLGVGGKILAGLAGVTVLGVNVAKSKLDANESKSRLDHRWESGHNQSINK